MSDVENACENLPLLSSHFPLVFEGGGRWECMTLTCSGCGNGVPPEETCGMVTRPFGQTYVVDAFGRCPDCDTVSRASYRLHPDMTMSGRSPRTGEWSTWEPRRGWLARLWAFLRRCLT